MASLRWACCMMSLVVHGHFRVKTIAMDTKAAKQELNLLPLNQTLLTGHIPSVNASSTSTPLGHISIQSAFNAIVITVQINRPVKLRSLIKLLLLFYIEFNKGCTQNAT